MGGKNAKRAWGDEYTLLCERCGYVIEGLPRGGACPECGKPIVESLPERRVGTAWQIRPGTASVAATWFQTVTHPRLTLDNMTLDRRHRGLRRAYLIVSSTVFAFFVCATLAINLFASSGKGPGSAELLFFVFGTTLLAWTASLCLLFLLAAVESVGLVILARRHGFRLSHGTAANICDHGSAGWVLASVGLAISGLVLAVLEAQPNCQVGLALWMTPVFAAVPGFLFFETFAWLGLRRLKYANSSHPGSVPGGHGPPADTA